jgi:DNA-directed RNA polymerase specialized sigma24 family protein
MGTITLHLRPAAHGDTNAQSVIYDRLYRELSPYAAVRARALRRFWDSADLLQHVFARFLFNPAKLSGFTSGSALREYARRSIDNKSRDIAKSAAFRRGSPAADLDFGAGWCAD